MSVKKLAKYGRKMKAEKKMKDLIAKGASSDLFGEEMTGLSKEGKMVDMEATKAFLSRPYKKGGKVGKTPAKKALGGKINPGADMQGRVDPQWEQAWHDANTVLEKGGNVPFAGQGSNYELEQDIKIREPREQGTNGHKEYAHSAIDGLIKKNGK